MLEDHYNNLMRIALGELGWSPNVAYYCDVNAILLAREGRIDLLCQIGLLKRETPLPAPTKGRDGQPIKLTPKIFDTLFAPPKGPPRRKPPVN